MVLLLLIASVLGISCFEIPLFLRNKWKKELWIFLLLMLAALAVSIMTKSGVKIPSPFNLIRWLYAPLIQSLDKVFG